MQNRKDCVAASQPADTGNDKANSNNKGTNGNNNESADDEVVTGGQNYSSSAIKIDGHHNEPSKISASPNLHSEFGISPENGELNAGHFRQVSMETARPIDASGVARQEHGEPNGSQVDEGLFTVREGTSHGAKSTSSEKNSSEQEALEDEDDMAESEGEEESDDQSVTSFASSTSGGTRQRSESESSGDFISMRDSVLNAPPESDKQNRLQDWSFFDEKMLLAAAGRDGAKTKNRRRRKRDKKTSEVVATVREDEEGEGK